MFYSNSLLEPLMILCSAWVIAVIIWVYRAEYKDRQERLKLGNKYSCKDFNKTMFDEINKNK